MYSIGTPLSKSAKKVMLLGAGELGKEICIALMRLGVEVIAVDRYANAPAMQVAHRAHIIDMLDTAALNHLVLQEHPHIIVPEIEAIATEALLTLENNGIQVVPSAKATMLTMNRESIRNLAAKELGLPTVKFEFADSLNDCINATKRIGFPCVIKPIMSSSGKGQTILYQSNQIESAWDCAQTSARGVANRVIIEAFYEFTYEITLLTIQTRDGIQFCPPIGHQQEQGDYQASWQPHPISEVLLNSCQEMANKIVTRLGGLGLFGVEFFIKDEMAVFNEVSPRPHDTGMVTMISQNLSEFDCHARAILGLPIPQITQYKPAASQVIVVNGHSKQVAFDQLDIALSQIDTDIRLFGKPTVNGKRRMGVGLALGDTLEEAKQKANQICQAVKIHL